MRDFDFQCSNGDWIKIGVEYEWLPTRCNECKLFGHSSGTCKYGLNSGNEDISTHPSDEKLLLIKTTKLMVLQKKRGWQFSRDFGTGLGRG